MAKKEKYFETKDVRVRASKIFWRKFNKWRSEQSYSTMADAVKAAMRNVCK